MTVRVLIVDDQAAFRSAARAVVDRSDGFEVSGEAASGEDAVELAAQLEPDLVLMDVNLGELDGIEATRRILVNRPSTKVVLVSTYELDELPPAIRASGAIGYLSKEDLSPRSLRRCWEDDDRGWGSAS